MSAQHPVTKLYEPSATLELNDGKAIPIPSKLARALVGVIRKGASGKMTLHFHAGKFQHALFEGDTEIIFG